MSEKRKQKPYLIQTYTLRSAINIPLQKDSLRDLLEFETGKGITRWEFLDDAMYRFEKGQHCFTWNEGGRLLCCAWFGYPEAGDNEVDLILESVYCHANSKDQLPSFLKSVVTAVAVNLEKNSIYILADDKLF